MLTRANCGRVDFIDRGLDEQTRIVDQVDGRWGRDPDWGGGQKLAQLAVDLGHGAVEGRAEHGPLERRASDCYSGVSGLDVAASCLARRRGRGGVAGGDIEFVL
jgi:hypothetical protein